MISDGSLRRSMARVVKRSVASSFILLSGLLAGACSTSQAGAPLYVGDQSARAAASAEMAEDRPDSVLSTGSAAIEGWGNYSGPRGQAVPPAPIRGVYQGDRG